MTVRPQPCIAVKNVKASSAWYQALLGTPSSTDPNHPHREFYDRIENDGRLVLQIHRWDDEDHPNLSGPELSKHGHGVLLWFEVDDFDAAVQRARKLGAKVLQDAHVNPAPNHWELWLEDADGYVVVIASPDGSAS